MKDPYRILVVEARFYDELADALLEGASDALRAQGADFDVITVPGALEVPGAIAAAEEAGRYPTAPRYAFDANKAAQLVYRHIRRDGTQQQVIDRMQTRQELYESIGYYDYEQKLDALFAQQKQS